MTFSEDGARAPNFNNPDRDCQTPYLQSSAKLEYVKCGALPLYKTRLGSTLDEGRQRQARRATMTGVFVQSAAILLREGLEALLVIAALAAYLEKSGASARLPALYGGALLAVLASIFAAWLFAAFNNGDHNDLIEAGIILCAAVLMLYVSGWLMLRQDPRAWQGFLKTKADEALARQTGIAVALLAFLAVFREGAESVLFVHALASTSGGWSAELLAGLLAGAAGLVVLFGAINFVARKLPLRPLFIATSAFLFFMALKFIGQAIQELQEQQIVTYSEIRRSGWLASVGFNPTLEAVSTQVAVVVLAVLTFVVLDRRGRKRAVDPARGKTSHIVPS